MDLAYNNLCRQNYKLLLCPSLRAIVQKSLNFLFFFLFCSRSLISRFIQRHRRHKKSQAHQRHMRVDAAITFFLTYEYHKSFRHSLRKKEKEKKMRKFVNVVKKLKSCRNINKSNIVKTNTISITNLFKLYILCIANQN